MITQPMSYLNLDELARLYNKKIELDVTGSNKTWLTQLEVASIYASNFCGVYFVPVNKQYRKTLKGTTPNGGRIRIEPYNTINSITLDGEDITDSVTLDTYKRIV